MKNKNQKFQEKINEKLGRNTFTLVGDYQGYKKENSFLCHKCNTIFKLKAEYLLRDTNKKCPTCYEEFQKNLKEEKRLKQKEKFLKRLKELRGDRFELVGEFTFMDKPTQFKCVDCGNIFDCSPKVMVRKTDKRIGCKHCYGKKRDNSSFAISEEEFLKRLKSYYPNNEFELVGKYKGYGVKTVFRHNVCGNENHISTPANLVCEKPRMFCSQCDKDRLKTTEEFKKEVYDLTNGEFEVLGEYRGNKKKIKFKHNVCGKTFFKSPNRFLNHNSCPHCCVNTKMDEDEFLRRFYSIPTNKEFKITSTFEGTKKPISVKHTCGEERIYTEAGNLYKRPVMCRKCHQILSVGELIIKKYLDSNKIEYEMEKVFPDCKYNNPLRFDFFIPEYSLLLEFDGIQHFEGWRQKGREDLKIIQKRDQIKNEWVKNSKKYSLIRIRYDQDVEKILRDIFINNEVDEDVFFICNY